MDAWVYKRWWWWQTRYDHRRNREEERVCLVVDRREISSKSHSKTMDDYTTLGEALRCVRAIMNTNVNFIW